MTSPISLGSRIRIAVVDDQPLFRVGICHTLRGYKQIDVIGEGEAPSDVLHQIEAQPLDLLIVGLTSPAETLASVEAALRMSPAVRLLIMSGCEVEEHVSATLRAGAKGYILRNVSGGDLFTAIRSVYSGHVYLTPSLGARLLARPAPSDGVR
jgi:DNA-binding NarL/FixJ family response regulator